MRVAFVAAAEAAVVRFVSSMNVRMFLSVAAVGETPVASLELAFERLFT